MSPIASSKTRTLRIPSREDLVDRTRKRLLRRGLARIQMTGLLVLTGATGFLSSFVLLKLGVESMVLRYPVAVALAYGVFLLLLRIWMHAQHEAWIDPVDVMDVAELGVDGLDAAAGFVPGRGASLESSGGSDFAFDLDLDLGLDFDLGGAGFLVLLAVLVAATAALSAAIWVCWTASGLFAEVLVDGLIMAALYRRLRQPQPTGWLASAVRRTCVPALIVALTLSIAGGILHKAVPGAHSLGAAWKAANAGSTPGAADEGQVPGGGR